MIVANYLTAVAVLCLGLYVVLTRRNLVKIVMGLSLIEASTYLLLLSMAYRAGSTAPGHASAIPSARRFAFAWSSASRSTPVSSATFAAAQITPT